MDEQSYLKILWVAMLAFCTAFIKELNDKAKNPEERPLMFISETLLHGVCGWLIGMLTLSITKNIYIVSFCAGVGGLLGMAILKVVIKILIAGYMGVKNIDKDTLDKINLDDQDDVNNNHK